MLHKSGGPEVNADALEARSDVKTSLPSVSSQSGDAP